MRKLMVAVAVGVAIYAIWHWRSTSPPSANQVEPLLSDYLQSGDSGKCLGAVTLDQLDHVSVGEYSSQFGGWPVYANHRETCRHDGISLTYDGSKDVERHVAAAFVRRSTTGRLEIYIPGFFADAQRQMEQSLQKAFDNIPTK